MAIPWMGMAALSGGLGLVGNIFGARSAASAAQAQMDASADQLSKNVMLNREARKGNLAKFIGQNVADYGYGAEEDFKANSQLSFTSTPSAGLKTNVFGVALNIDRCSIGWCVGPSSPKPIES